MPVVTPLTPAQVSDFEPLTIALLGAMPMGPRFEELLPPSVAADLVSADSARASRVHAWLTAIADERSEEDLLPNALDVLRPMLVRDKGHNILAEIEGEKKNEAQDADAYAQILTDAPAYRRLRKSQLMRLNLAFLDVSAIELKRRETSTVQHLVCSAKGVELLSELELSERTGPGPVVVFCNTEMVGAYMATDEIQSAVSAAAQQGRAELEVVVARHFYNRDFLDQLIYDVEETEMPDDDY